MVRVAEVVACLEEWFPLRGAESWDNVGLLLGDEEQPVHRVMTTLTVTPESADEAIREKVDLVVTHHPIFFRKVSRLTAQGPDRAAYALARAGISVYSPHTAFDGARAGINEQWAAMLDLVDVIPLIPADQPSMGKVVVFVPASDLLAVRQALFEAGGGVIGEYEHCSFRTLGTGSFKGSDASHPAVGKAGVDEEVEEYRLEALVPTCRVESMVEAIRRAHSYEEPAIDVYPLVSAKDRVGAGRMGKLKTPIGLQGLASRVGKAVGLSTIEVVGPDEPCHRVAIGCGAAGDLLSPAVRAGCDVFVTGEARFHDYLAAREQGIKLILVGHYASERFALERLAERLTQQFSDIQVWASRDETNPSRTIQVR